MMPMPSAPIWRSIGNCLRDDAAVTLPSVEAFVVTTVVAFPTGNWGDMVALLNQSL
jgi:hypothetical protein